MSIAAGAAAGYLQRSLRREIPLFLCANAGQAFCLYSIFLI